MARLSTYVDEEMASIVDDEQIAHYRHCVIHYLPDEVFQALSAAAAAENTRLDDWIMRQCSDAFPANVELVTSGNADGTPTDQAGQWVRNCRGPQSGWEEL